MHTVCGPCLGEPRSSRVSFAGTPTSSSWLSPCLFAGQSMTFSLAINISPPEEPGVRLVLQGLIFGATLIVLALLGGPLLRTAATELRRGRLTIEALFVTTILGAQLASLQWFVTGKGPIYFEVVSVLLVVYSFGKQVGRRSRDTALAAARAWSESLASCRLLDAGGNGHSTPVAGIVPGPCSTCPVRPHAGRSLVSRSPGLPWVGSGTGGSESRTGLT